MAKNKPMLNLMLKRKEAKLTQAALAELVGVKKLTISAYERGQNFPRRATLEKLAGVFNCEVKDII